MCHYKPKYVYWELSNYCNLRCRHCFADAVSGKASIINQSLVCTAISKMCRESSFAVRFGGGEPLMVPYIFDIIAFCRQQGIEVDMTTNGTLLSYDILSKLYFAGLRELTISVDGLNEMHDYIRGKGTYLRTLQGIKNAISYGKIELSIAFTVTALNFSEIEEFVESFVLLGITKFYFFRYCGSKNSELLELSTSQLHAAAITLHELTQKYVDVTLIHEGFSFYVHQLSGVNIGREGCNFLKNVLSIDYIGNVVVCAAINKILGNIFIDSLATIYSKITKEQELMRHLPDGCTVCRYGESCHGGCKSHSYLTYGNYEGKDPLCFMDKLNEQLCATRN